MLIKKRELNKLPPSYKEEIIKLEEKIAAKKYKRSRGIKNLLTEFSQNYLMLPQFWDEYFNVTREVVRSLYTSPSLKYFYSRKEHAYLRIKSRKHFFSHEILNGRDHGFVKLLNEPPELYQEFVDYNTIKDEIRLPRKNLNKTWRCFKEYSGSSIPKEAFLMYEKSEKLYDEIIAAENDTQKWFKLISQIEDTEYVCNNAEYKIGNNMNNAQLWKLYINYLKKNDIKRLLYVYSCYCRFFLDDKKMKAEYKKASKKYGPSIVHWKNAFDFEKYEKEVVEEAGDKNRMEEEKECKRVKLTDLEESWKNYHEPNICESKLTNSDKISILNSQNQIFSLPKTIMNYIIKGQNSSVLHKLHKSCKYFFMVLPYPACHNVILAKGSPHGDADNGIKFFEQSMIILFDYGYNASTDSINFDRKLIITNTFNCCHLKETILSSFLPKIFQCNAKYIRIHQQHFTFKEFKFLVGHGEVEMLHLFNVELVDENDLEFDIELQQILELTPKIAELEISRPEIVDETFETLAEFNFTNKFKIFNLRQISELEPHGFSQFLKKNLDSKSELSVTFRYNIPQNVAQNAITIIEKELKDYWPKNDQPKIDVHHSGHQDQGFRLGG